jgi:transposase
MQMSHIPEGDRMQSRIMCLDDMVADDSMVRIIDRFMDTVDLEGMGFSNTQPSVRGRSSYSPRTLAKLYLFCYEEGIRSSRRIEKACLTNVEVMWLTGSLAPDFKTIADFRRNNIDPLTGLFYEFASFLDFAGLYGKKVVAIDGTKVRASNSKKRNISKKAAKRRVDHHRDRVADYLRQIEATDDLDTIEELAEKIEVAQKRADEAKALLADMEAAGVGEVSLTDPDARCMGNGRQGVDVAYNVQAAVDAECHLVAGIDVTNHPDDHGQLSNMAFATQETMRSRDMVFLADKGYYGGDDLAVCKEAGVDCIVACQTKPKGAFGKGYATEDFTYDGESDSYICPRGVKLSCTSRPDSKESFYSNPKACRACGALEECQSTGLTYRRIRRRPVAEALEWAEERYDANSGLYRLRQLIVEHPFGTVKRAMSGDHFLLRGLEKVRCEAALLFTGYNLKRSLKVLGFEGMMAKLDEYAALTRQRGGFMPLFAAIFMSIYASMRAIRGFLAQSHRWGVTAAAPAQPRVSSHTA